MGGAGERTERATAKRKRDERKKGNVFMSQEINILLSLLAAVYVIRALAEWILSALTQGFRFFWGEAAVIPGLTTAVVRENFVGGLAMFAAAAGIPLLAAGLVAIVTTLAQTKGLVTFSKLKPDFAKLSPLKGLKRLFSVRGLVELLKSILKIVILAYVIYNQYIERYVELPRLMEMEMVQALYYCGAFLMDIVTTTAIAFAFLAAADYLYQRWQYERDLRMTKQEIKEEYKQTEGDPKIKGKIRQKQREMSMSRMMQQVPQADVVIRNPTHYAVAIRYEAGKNRAPVVLAKGADYMALRIIRKAEESGVLCMEDRPLARSLYENVPLDREIPEKFFQPVAEILAFVYETSKREKLPKNIRRKKATS